MGDVLRFVSLRRPTATGIGVPKTVTQLRKDVSLSSPAQRMNIQQLREDLALLEHARMDLEVVVQRLEAAALAKGREAAGVSEGASYGRFRRGPRRRAANTTVTPGAAFPPQAEVALSLRDVTAKRSQAEQKRFTAMGLNVHLVTSPAIIDNMLAEAVEDIRGTANALCSEGVSGDFKSDTKRPGQIRATLTGIGLADLLKVTERVVGYQVREIADTSNVLPRERWERKTRLLTESEVERISAQTVTELQSTNVRTSERFELSTETEKTVNTKFSVEAGVDVSAKYGVTKIDSSLDVAFARDSTQSRATATEFAQEVVRETVDSIEKSSSESVRRLLKESRMEALVKGIDRTEDSTGYTGYLFWLDKLHELQIRSWGTRLMAEFYVLEPSETVVTAGEAPSEDPPAPPPLDFNPSAVNALNYLCLAKRYQTSAVSPPPPKYQSVSWSWRSEPDEQAGGGNQDTVNGVIEIPRGYVPIEARVVTASHSARDDADWFVDLGGRTAVSVTRALPKADYVSLVPVATEAGIHVVIRVYDHHDKTGVVNVFIKCAQTPSVYEDWQVVTWGAYLDGFQAMQAEYRRAMDQSALETNNRPPGRHPDLNRRLERTELKKWIIEALRNITGAPPATHASPAAIRFYEQAFEWQQMAYVFYGYQWATKELQPVLRAVEDPDQTHEAFLGSGAARVLVSITPGYEARVINFLEATTSEAERVDFAPDTNYNPGNSDLSAAWQELVQAKDSDLVVGVGSLNVQNGKEEVAINSGTFATWNVTDSDLGRELVIEGTPYEIGAIDSANHKISLDRKYEDPDNVAARYLAGSRRLGPPWQVAVPSTLVALHEGLSVLGATPDWMPTPVNP